MRRLSMKKVLFIPLLITVIVAQTVDYDTDIQPLWNANCTSCHGANGSGGGDLRAMMRAFMAKGTGGKGSASVRPELANWSVRINKINN